MAYNWRRESRNGSKAEGAEKKEEAAILSQQPPTTTEEKMTDQQHGQAQEAVFATLFIGAALAVVAFLLKRLRDSNIDIQ